MSRTLFSEEHLWFRDSVAGFVQRRLQPVRESSRELRSISRELWTECGELGFLGLGIPSEYGGSDVDDFRFNAVLGEEFAAVAIAFASCIGIHTDIVAPYLRDLATREQKERWLPAFCSGKAVSAMAMSEPGVGSDLARLRTHARRHNGDWLLNGTKTFITNGYGADLIVVAGRTGEGKGAQGITLFLVDGAAKGVMRGRKLDKVGQPEADTAEIFFEDVRLSEESVLGEIDGGFAHMMERLPQERLSVAVVNTAHADMVLSLTLDYVKERQAFGRSIGSFQHNRFVLAELVTMLEVTRAYVDQCIALHVRGGLTSVDAAKAKWWSADVQNKVIDSCVQLHGGYGYMQEYEVARAWCDARVTRIWGGTDEIMKEIIGRSLGLGDPRPA